MIVPSGEDLDCVHLLRRVTQRKLIGALRIGVGTLPARGRPERCPGRLASNLRPAIRSPSKIRRLHCLGHEIIEFGVVELLISDERQAGASRWERPPRHRYPRSIRRCRRSDEALGERINLLGRIARPGPDAVNELDHFCGRTLLGEESFNGHKGGTDNERPVPGLSRLSSSRDRTRLCSSKSPARSARRVAAWSSVTAIAVSLPPSSFARAHRAIHAPSAPRSGYPGTEALARHLVSAAWPPQETAGLTRGEEIRLRGSGGFPSCHCAPPLASEQTITQGSSLDHELVQRGIVNCSSMISALSRMISVPNRRFSSMSAIEPLPRTARTRCSATTGSMASSASERRLRTSST